MNILKVNAYYENFCKHFGKVILPLYKTDNRARKLKKHLFTYSTQSQMIHMGISDKKAKKMRKKRGSVNMERVELNNNLVVVNRERLK